MSWKTFRKISEPLEDMSYERYLRIIGLFDAIPASELSGHAAALAEQFQKKAEAIEALVNPDKTHFVVGNASDLVHNLQLLLMQLLPLHVLTCFVPALREDFREAVGDAVYQRYLAAETSVHLRNPCLAPTVLNRLARADALYVINETRRQILAQRHIEETRAFLLQTLTRGWRRIVVPLFAFLFIFLLCKGIADLYVFGDTRRSESSNESVNEAGNSATTSASPGPEAPGVTGTDLNTANQPNAANSSPTPRPSATPARTKPSVVDRFVDTFGNLFIEERRSNFSTNPQAANPSELPQETALYQMLTAAALLSFAALAGACGAFASVVNRIQRITDSSKIGRNIWVLKNSSTSVAYAPAIGATFAVVLSIILAGGLISGSLFPQLFPDDHWFFTLWKPREMAKWLVWAFIAGFSERLVPDMLDRLTARAGNEDKAEAITSPPPKVAPTPDSREELLAVPQADAAIPQTEKKDSEQ